MESDARGGKLHPDNLAVRVASVEVAVVASAAKGENAGLVQRNVTQLRAFPGKFELFVVLFVLFLRDVEAIIVTTWRIGSMTHA